MKDHEIARRAVLKPIESIASASGIGKRYLEPCGRYKAKVSLEILDKTASRKTGTYVVVTGITPTPLGEGKTVTTIGLSMALNRLGRRSVSTIRQSSLGPLFGIKGGGTGGGLSQVVPRDDISLHLTGDFHAVTAAHNLLAAFLDNHIYRGNKLGIDRERIFWDRVVDVSDRSLRHVRVGVGGGESGIERSSRFDITAASEIMAILALADSLPELYRRISKIVVALTEDGEPVTCADLKVAGAMTALLKDAIKPTLVQTLEHTPCLIHAGPFANILHGNSSVIADKIALKTADFVVTESGFGVDCGAEKFFDIKCRYGRLVPDVAVLVSSVRALKAHSGRFKVSPGRPLDKGLLKEDIGALEEGCANLEKQIENVKTFGIPCVVAINRFGSDTKREIETVKRRSGAAGAFACAVSELYRHGSGGGIELAEAVVRASGARRNFRFLYPAGLPIKDKIETIAKKMYGARSVQYGAVAESDIALWEGLGFGRFPVCMAKTHLSLSHDPSLKGRPRHFDLPVRGARLFAGAGFISPLCGNIMTMPSLPSRPLGEKVGIDSKGNIKGI
ncbi:MAG: formate--tetrahydrofolate ligase [Candidatus Omnitrophota bacterium]